MEICSIRCCHFAKGLPAGYRDKISLELSISQFLSSYKFEVESRGLFCKTFPVSIKNRHRCAAQCWRFVWPRPTHGQVESRKLLFAPSKCVYQFRIQIVKSSNH